MRLEEKVKEYIIVLELKHFAYSHESFNSGTVWQNAIVNPDYTVCYCAERESVARVRSIIPNCDNIEYIVLEELDDIRNGIDVSYEKIYLCILEHLFSVFTVRRMIITGNDYHNCVSFDRIISRHTNTDFYFFQHSEIENLLDDGRIKRWGRYKVRNIKYRLGIDRVIVKDYTKQIQDRIKGVGKKEKKAYMDSLELLAKNKNAFFYVFSDEYKKYELPISSTVLDKFKRIYLPYVYDSGKSNKSKGTMRFLVCASTAESRDGLVWKIINYVNNNRHRINGEYEFVLGGGDSRCMRNTVLYANQERGQKDLQLAMDYCDCLLLPYPECRYRLSFSGVMTDAINMRIPVIMGASGCFNEVEKYEIGLRGYNVKEIGEIIISIINGDIVVDDKRIIAAYEQLKKHMYCHNIQEFKI